MVSQCVICKTNETKTVFTEFGVDIVKCRKCGHVFSSHENSQFYDGYFEQQDLETTEQFWWNAAHQAMYDDFCQRFIAGKSGKILDVGCGLGYFVKHVSNYTGWAAYGCEISVPAVQYAKSKLGLSNIVAGKIEEADLPDSPFDLITLWDVIEHIPNPDPFLAKVRQLLRPGGTLFLHTPNIRIQLPKARLKRMLKGMDPKVHYLEAKDHVNIYSEKTISVVLGRNGFGKIKFIHLKPVRSVSGSRNPLLSGLKDVWAGAAGLIYKITGEKVNIGNLFIVAE